MNRYKPVGWKFESQRHSLAAKGIKTSFSPVYALSLEGDKYYVGSAKDPKARIAEHKEGKGAKWTKLHPVKRVLSVTPGSKKEEDIKTKELEEKYGHEAVRGGRWAQRKFDDPFIQLKSKGYESPGVLVDRKKELNDEVEKMIGKGGMNHERFKEVYSELQEISNKQDAFHDDMGLTRKALVLWTLTDKGLTDEQIAEEVGSSLSTVKAAKESWRRILTDKGVLSFQKGDTRVERSKENEVIERLEKKSVDKASELDVPKSVQITEDIVER